MANKLLLTSLFLTSTLLTYGQDEKVDPAMVQKMRNEGLHLQAENLKQAATVVASFVYSAAMRDQKLPRKAPSAQAAR